MRVIIIGGVAGGMSAATRLRTQPEYDAGRIDGAALLPVDTSGISGQRS
ncbi:hypothetical protein [Blastococcus sp. Marseille-P5729]|nr:hypothetical protein [Blastococcus sp. Marseille-P5729]